MAAQTIGRGHEARGFVSGAARGVVRGGDGGVAPVAGGMTHDRDNGMRVLTGRDLEARPEKDPDRQAFEARLVPTADPDDRAHLVRDGLGRLVPARDVPGAQKSRVQPRLYPRELMVTVERGGVIKAFSQDSACERLAGAQARLAEEGVDLGVRSRSGPGLGESTLREVDARATCRLRDIIERRTTQGMTAAEAALERAADRMLRGR